MCDVTLPYLAGGNQSISNTDIQTRAAVITQGLLEVNTRCFTEPLPPDKDAADTALPFNRSSRTYTILLLMITARRWGPSNEMLDK